MKNQTYPHSILRSANKPTHFVKYDNAALKDSKLSFSATGLHGYAMSQSDDWELHFNAITTQKGSTRHHTRMALYELEAHGYAMSMRPLGGKGRTRIVIAETKEVMRQFFLDNPDLAFHYYQQAIRRKGFSFVTPPPCVTTTNQQDDSLEVPF